MPIQSSSRNSSARNSMASNGSTRLSSTRTAVHAKDKASRKDVPISLKNMTMEGTSKCPLRAELLAMVFDHLGAEDLISVARCSRQLRDMVYDDTRWVRRLKQIGCWNEAEARREAERERALNPLKPDIAPGANMAIRIPTLALPKKPNAVQKPTVTEKLSEGFDAVELDSTPSHKGKKLDIADATTVLKNVRSCRGTARNEYGKVHAALAPFYDDIVNSSLPVEEIPSQSTFFKAYGTPEQQALILANIQAFARSDNACGGTRRQDRLLKVINLFETAALREFRAGYETGDVDGLMRRYARVLVMLNGGTPAMELFIQHNHMVTRKSEYGVPAACIDRLANTVSLEQTHEFLTRLGVAYTEEMSIMNRCFDTSSDIFQQLLDKVAQDVLTPYFTAILDEIHQRNVASYLATLPGVFMQVYNFLYGLKPVPGNHDACRKLALETSQSIFQLHLDVYIAEELSFFQKQAETVISAWDKQLSDWEASEESLYMSNINRQADKRDLLATFKKVLRAPVNILPSFSINKNHSNIFKADGSQSPIASTPQTPSSPAAPTYSPFSPISRSSTPQLSTRVSSPRSRGDAQLPTTELAAKAAIMNSRLESIRSLFSIEVALDLVHKGRTSLEHMAQFVKLPGAQGEAAKTQCEAIFVTILLYLGHRHVIAGFDKAIDHLSEWRSNQSKRISRGQQPCQHTPDEAAGLGSLVKFLELVNVGDLIMQMMDAFYEQELIATKLVNRDDFLAPAVKEKKKFEQKLDERVALGLNKGIDVLMDKVEYILATKQQSLDFNPEATGSNDSVDIGASAAAREVVDIMSNHARMLVGSIDKSTFDVFNQEIGLRLFASLCKHLKLQRISVMGAIKLISDMSHYSAFIQTMKNEDLSLYFTALRELAQIYLIAPSDSKELATIIADVDRFHGIFRAEEVYEFATRRADWYQVKASVDSAMFGIGCCLM
ncbi:F-box protein: endocytic membrane traffic, recycling ReCYcling 1 [Ascosphaera aggregata]|nr:F-box protein: endocytic membrane traffic, recycling ReCYcling 1 [Ascosphaera aggregata]